MTRRLLLCLYGTALLLCLLTAPQAFADPAILRSGSGLDVPDAIVQQITTDFPDAVTIHITAHHKASITNSPAEEPSAGATPGSRSPASSSIPALSVLAATVLLALHKCNV